ncbi:MAG: type II secretion system protein [Alphaproteobacteria bacterium]|nr:type II secretion system protein [Alphaproteobacteria bacterium]
MKKYGEQGFTLTEMAIVLLISGILTSTFLLALQTYTKKEMVDQTREAITLSNNATFAFQVARGYYPCPANPALGPGDAGYGYADCAAAAVVVGERDIDGDGNNETYLVGAVPFNTFLDMNADGNFNDPVFRNQVLYQDPRSNSMLSTQKYISYGRKHALDKWGNKLTYAVTLSQTDYETVVNGNPRFFDQDAGVLDIVDEQFHADPNDATLLQVRGSANYVIVSHGENGVGAFTKDGALVQNCGLGLTLPEQTAKDIEFALGTPPDETENCDQNDGIFLQGVHSYRKSIYNDDYVEYTVPAGQQLWAFTGSVPNDNGTPDDPDDDFFIPQLANQNSGGIAIGIKNAPPSEKVHVDGDIQAFEVHANQLCDSNGHNCMLPDAIGGELNQMKCPNVGEVVIRIEQNAVTCVNPFANMPANNCPNGAYGISSKTGLLCL